MNSDEFNADGSIRNLQTALTRLPSDLCQEPSGDTRVETDDGADETRPAFLTAPTDSEISESHVAVSASSTEDDADRYERPAESLTPEPGTGTLKSLQTSPSRSSSGTPLIREDGQKSFRNVPTGLNGNHRSSYLYERPSAMQERRHHRSVDPEPIEGIDDSLPTDVGLVPVPIWNGLKRRHTGGQRKQLHPKRLKPGAKSKSKSIEGIGGKQQCMDLDATKIRKGAQRQTGAKRAPPSFYMDPASENIFWQEKYRRLRKAGPFCYQNTNNLMRLFREKWQKDDLEEISPFGFEPAMIYSARVKHMTYGFLINPAELLPAYVGVRVREIFRLGCVDMARHAVLRQAAKQCIKRGPIQFLDRYKSSNVHSMSLTWQSRLGFAFPIRLRLLARLNGAHFGTADEFAEYTAEEVAEEKEIARGIDVTMTCRREILMSWFGECDFVTMHCAFPSGRLTYLDPDNVTVQYVPWAVRARYAPKCRGCSSCEDFLHFRTVVLQIEEAIKNREFILRCETEVRSKYKGTICRDEPICIVSTSKAKQDASAKDDEYIGTIDCMNYDCPKMLNSVGKFGPDRTIVAPLSQGFFPHLASMFLVIRHHELLDELSRSDLMCDNPTVFNSKLASLQRRFRNPVDKGLCPIPPATTWTKGTPMTERACDSLAGTASLCRRVLEYQCSAIHKTWLRSFPGLEQNIFACALKALSTVTVLTTPLGIESWILDNVYAPLQLQPSAAYARRWLAFHENVLRESPDTLAAATELSYMSINQSWLHPCQSVAPSILPMRDLAVLYEYPSFPTLRASSSWGDVADYFAKQACKDYWPGATTLYYPNIHIDIRCPVWEKTTPCASGVTADTESQRINTPHAIVISTGSRVAYIPVCEYMPASDNLQSLTLLKNTKAHYEDVYLARFRQANVIRYTGFERCPLLRDFLGSARIKKLVTGHPGNIARQLIFCGLPVQGLVPVIPDVAKVYARPTEWPYSWVRYTLYDMWMAIRELIPVFVLQVYYSCFLVGAGVECRDWRRLPEFLPSAVFDAIEKDSWPPHLIRCGDVHEPQELKGAMTKLAQCLDLGLKKMQEFAAEMFGVTNHRYS